MFRWCLKLSLFFLFLMAGTPLSFSVNTVPKTDLSISAEASEATQRERSILTTENLNSYQASPITELSTIEMKIPLADGSTLVTVEYDNTTGTIELTYDPIKGTQEQLYYKEKLLDLFKDSQILLKKKPKKNLSPERHLQFIPEIQSLLVVRGTQGVIVDLSLGAHLQNPENFYFELPVSFNLIPETVSVQTKDGDGGLQTAILMHTIRSLYLLEIPKDYSKLQPPRRIYQTEQKNFHLLPELFIHNTSQKGSKIRIMDTQGNALWLDLSQFPVTQHPSFQVLWRKGMSQSLHLEDLNTYYSVEFTPKSSQFNLIEKTETKSSQGILDTVLNHIPLYNPNVKKYTLKVEMPILSEPGFTIDANGTHKLVFHTENYFYLYDVFAKKIDLKIRIQKNEISSFSFDQLEYTQLPDGTSIAIYRPVEKPSEILIVNRLQTPQNENELPLEEPHFHYLQHVFESLFIPLTP